MLKNRENNLGIQIIEKAKGFGECLAGIANVEALKECPSHELRNLNLLRIFGLAFCQKVVKPIRIHLRDR